jgi:hypothetical protein
MPFPIIKIVYEILCTVFRAIYEFAKWFYLQFLPFILQYIAIPLFALGVILGLAFTFGTFIFVVIFFIFMYFFIKGTIFS